MGSIYLLRDSSSREGMDLLEKVLETHPDYQPAVNALRRSGVIEVSNPQEMDAETFGIVTEAILAEQHRVLPDPPGRILGAGLPVPPKEYVYLGES
jgi:hypothetical protein